MITSSNPGAMKPYALKNPRSIIGSFSRKLRQGELVDGLKFLLSETINLLNRKKITSTQGKFYCPICRNNSGAFVHLSNRMRFSWNSACGHCSSRARHRGLFYVYKDSIKGFTVTHSILHFAPEPAFYPIFKNKEFKYVTSDYLLEDVDLPNQDIQALTLEDNQFDLVICNHVIEHVPDDMKALKEMYRILKPGGKLLLTIPGNFKRNKTLYFDHLRYNGHYRDYGKDFLKIFESIFTDHKIVELKSKQGNLNLAIRNFEWLFVGEKNLR